MKLNDDERALVLSVITVALNNHLVLLKDWNAKNLTPTLEDAEEHERRVRLTRSAMDKITALLSVDLSKEDEP